METLARTAIRGYNGHAASALGDFPVSARSPAVPIW